MTDQLSSRTSATSGSAPSRARVTLDHATVITPDLDRFRRFYEDVIGLRLVVVEHPAGAPFGRAGAFVDQDSGSMAVLAIEVPGYSSGLDDDRMGRRGRVDHIALLAEDQAGFDDVVERLVDAGASSGVVEQLGPMRSVLFVDPDGGHHNLQLLTPDWQPEPSAEVLDAQLLARLLRPGSDGAGR